MKFTALISAFTIVVAAASWVSAQIVRANGALFTPMHSFRPNHARYVTSAVG